MKPRTQDQIGQVLVSGPRIDEPSRIVGSHAPGERYDYSNTGYILRDDGIGNALFVNPSQPFSAGALVTSAERRGDVLQMRFSRSGYG